METENQQPDEQQPSDGAGDESTQEFKEEVENDPATASGNEEEDRLIGG